MALHGAKLSTNSSLLLFSLSERREKNNEGREKMEKKFWHYVRKQYEQREPGEEGRREGYGVKFYPTRRRRGGRGESGVALCHTAARGPGMPELGLAF